MTNLTYKEVKGRIVAETYIPGFNKAPTLVFWIRHDGIREKVAVPAPFKPYGFIKQSQWSEELRGLLKEKVGFFKAFPLPIEEACIAEEQDQAVMQVEVNHPQQIRAVREACKELGVTPYEMDVPFTRNVKKQLGIFHKIWVTKNGEIKPYDGEVEPLQVAFYDLELDDTNAEAIKKGNARIISASVVHRDGRETSYLDDDEMKMLYDLKTHLVSQVDLLVGWNSEEFDDEQMADRMRATNLAFDKNDIQYLDMLKLVAHKVEKRRESYKLDAVVNEELVKARQVYPATITRLKGYMRYFTGQVTGDKEQDRQVLRLVNLSHSRAVKDLDAALEMVDMRCNLADFAGIQAEDTYYYSRIIDTLVMRKFAEHKPRLIARCRIESEEHVVYEGAKIFDPVPGQYDNVLHFDLKSLYNRIVQTFNISPELWSETRKNIVVADFNNDVARAKTDAAGFEALIDELRKLSLGIFPVEMLKLENWRNILKKEKKKWEHDPQSAEFKKAYATDYTVKSTLLAFYGQLGEPRSRFFIPLMAGLVTHAGRELLRATAKELERLGFKIIYGDTDSIFCTPSDEVLDEWKTFELGDKIEKYLNEEFYPNLLATRWSIPSDRRRIAIEFAGVYKTIFFGEQKKKYAGLTYVRGKDNEGKPTIGLADSPEIVGFEKIRSDWCSLARDTQERAITMRLNRVAKDEVKEFLYSIKNDLLDGKFTDQLVIAKGITKALKEYANTPPHVRAAQKLVDAGEQLEFKVQFVVATSKKGSIDRVEPIIDPKIIPEIKNSGRVYYWQKQVLPPALRVLWGMFTEEEVEQLTACKIMEPNSMDYYLQQVSPTG